jgi:flagellar biosynthesis/type III secretory pathway protein FliH
MKTGKIPEKLRTIPRAQTLRVGSYKLLDGAADAVVIKPSEARRKKGAELNDADWFLTLVDAVSEKAEDAYYIGLNEGFLLGLDRGRKEAMQAAQHFRGTLIKMERDLTEFFAGVERWSVKLAMNIAEKVIGQVAEQQQDLVRLTVQKALQETADKTRILIRVHPSDYQVLKEIRSEITALSEGIEHFKIEADGSVTPGSCKIETPSGLLDADFTTQLSELRRALILKEEAVR